MLVIAAIVVVTSHGSGHPTRSAVSNGAKGRSAGPGAPHILIAGAPPAAEAGLLPWTLPSPRSRETVLAGLDRDRLLVLGGLDPTGASRTSSLGLALAGVTTSAGTLALATHDAAGAVLNSAGLLFGGGNAAPSSTVERIEPDGGGQVVGSLPEARADASAVQLNGVAYLVGGYSGTGMDPEVLSTTDGVHFALVTVLALAVRYPALAVLGGRIYAFGGQDGAGRAVDAVQVIDPVRRTSSVVAHLPIALSGASAATLDGAIYLAGGESAPGVPSSDIYAFTVKDGRALLAGHLLDAVAYAGSATLGGRLFLVGGEGRGGHPVDVVQTVNARRAFGLAGSPGAGSPYVGDQLLVADRGNDRLLLLDDTGRIIWRYPSPSAPAPAGGFYFPDDAFFMDHGHEIISNQEENETIVKIAYPSGRIDWSFGHPRQPGAAPGYLNNPDDAYPLRNGDIVVADPKNCRVLVLSSTKRVLGQIGTNGICRHQPPNELGSPNGDTPLADGNLLISEINGSFIDEYSLAGKLIWSTHLAIGYPSDPQELGPDLYLVADYENPGSIVEFNRAGRILFRYGPSTGSGELNRPSLAVRTPSGVLMANDDYNDRMVAIDPQTGALVWQYGVTGVASTAVGYLSIPDGFDLLAPGGSTPLHPVTG